MRGLSITAGLVVFGIGAATPVWSACVESSTTDLQLQILGSGGPRASSGRGSAAYLLWVDGVDVFAIHLGGPETSTGMVAELHAKPSAWVQMAQAANVGHLIVSHVSTSSTDELAERLGYLESKYSGSLAVAEDLMCVDVE